MALESRREGNVIMRVVADTKLPKMARVRQLLDHSCYSLEQLRDVIQDGLEREAFRSQIKPGMRVAITCGSRGVANIAFVLRTIVDFVKSRGAEPFVFPAMGSHGGACVDGQLEILRGYAVTEETMGCPILATMDVVHVGDTPEGMPVYTDRFAHEADAIILCNRIKPHTGFRGPYESGLMKMAVIGMGKQHGAEQVHQDGFSDLGRLLPVIGRVVLENNKVIGGVGLVENAFDETCCAAVLTKDEIYTEEPKLLKLAYSRMGRLLLNDLDVLVVDRIGKDCSGDGMDPNVTGRFLVSHVHNDYRVQHIAVLDLTDASHGNCIGLGNADVTTKRLIDRIDVDASYPNAITSTVLLGPKIPLFTHSDQSCIQAALKTCNYIDRDNPRIIRIRDTMHLEDIWISEAMVEEVRSHPMLEVLEEPKEWPFDENGNLW